MGSGNATDINRHTDILPQADSWWDSMPESDIAALKPGSADVRTVLRAIMTQLKRVVQADDAGGDWRASVIKRGLALKHAGLPRFFNTGVEHIYVDPTNGSDTTGDGLTSSTPYKTIQRAVDDVPHRYKADVVINVMAGTHAAAESVEVAVAPGGTSNRISIVGARTALETWTSVPSGTLATGKRCKMQHTVAAFSTTITDGDFWLYDEATAGLPAPHLPLADSASPTLVVAKTTTSWASGISSSRPLSLTAYNTVFSGAFTIRAPTTSPEAPSGSARIDIIGIKFTNGISARGVRLRGCNMSATAATKFVTLNQTSLEACYLGANCIHSLTSASTVAHTLVKDVSVQFNGPNNNFQSGVTKGTCGGATHKVFVGALALSVSNVQPLGHAAEMRLLGRVDMEHTTGAGVSVSGKSTCAITTFGPTLALNGSFATVEQGGVFNIANGGELPTGTVTAPIVVKTGGRLVNFQGLTITNSSAAGNDVQFEIGKPFTFAQLGGALSCLSGERVGNLQVKGNAEWLMNTPAQITGDQVSYDPGPGRVHRLSSDASRAIQGLFVYAANDGQELVLINVGSNPIVLANEHASASAARRIITGTGSDATINANGVATLLYDGTSQRWRLIHLR